jgi:hypothetical protein
MKLIRDRPGKPRLRTVIFSYRLVLLSLGDALPWAFLVSQPFLQAQL